MSIFSVKIAILLFFYFFRLKVFCVTKGKEKMAENLKTKDFDACSEESLKAQYSTFVKQETANGEKPRVLEIREPNFSNRHEALLWLEYHCNKFGPAIAVKVGDFSKQFPVKLKDKKIVEKHAQIKKQLENWNNNILKNAHNGTKKQVTCCKCHSKISISFMKANECPVCGDNDILHSKGEISKLEKLRIAFSNLEIQLQEAKDAYEANNKKRISPFWLVASWIGK